MKHALRRSACKILVLKTEAREREREPLGKSRCRWKDKEDVDWVHRLDIVDTVMNLRVPSKSWESLR